GAHGHTPAGGLHRSPRERVSRREVLPRRAKAADDAVEVGGDEVAADEVTAFGLVRLVLDAGFVEAGAELPLPGEHLSLGDLVEPVDRVGAVAGDHEHTLAAVAVDVLHRV